MIAFSKKSKTHQRSKNFYWIMLKAQESVIQIFSLTLVRMQSTSSRRSLSMIQTKEWLYRMRLSTRFCPSCTVQKMSRFWKNHSLLCTSSSSSTSWVGPSIKVESPSLTNTLDLLYEECLYSNFPEFRETVDENIRIGKGNLEHIVKNGELYFDTKYDEEE